MEVVVGPWRGAEKYFRRDWWPMSERGWGMRRGELSNQRTGQRKDGKRIAFLFIEREKKEDRFCWL